MVKAYLLLFFLFFVAGKPVHHFPSAKDLLHCINCNAAATEKARLDVERERPILAAAGPMVASAVASSAGDGDVVKKREDRS